MNTNDQGNAEAGAGIGLNVNAMDVLRASRRCVASSEAVLARIEDTMLFNRLLRGDARSVELNRRQSRFTRRVPRDGRQAVEREVGD